MSFVDLAKGIGLLMVIYLHITINYPDIINIYKGSSWDRFVHTMFMPIFFILSGLFFSANMPFKEWLTKKIKRLVLPFFIFYTLTYILNVILVSFFNVNLKSGFSYNDIFVVFYKDVYPNSAIWFLLALFWSSILFYAILKLTNKLWLQTILVLVAFSIGIVFDKAGINIPLYIDTAFTATIFIYTGYLLKRYKLVPILETYNKRLQIFIMAVTTIVGFLICWHWGQGVSMVNNANGNPLLFYLTATFGSLSVIAFSYIFQKIPIVSYIGRYSMFVLCTHMFLTNAFAKLILKINLSFIVSSVATLLLVCSCYYLIIPIVKKIKIANNIL